MNKQFTIKASQALKNLAKSATKSELTTVLKLDKVTRDTVCCDFMPDITGIEKPVFAL